MMEYINSTSTFLKPSKTASFPLRPPKPLTYAIDTDSGVSTLGDQLAADNYCGTAQLL